MQCEGLWMIRDKLPCLMVHCVCKPGFRGQMTRNSPQSLELHYLFVRFIKVPANHVACIWTVFSVHSLSSADSWQPILSYSVVSPSTYDSFVHISIFLCYQHTNLNMTTEVDTPLLFFGRNTKPMFPKTI